VGQIQPPSKRWKAWPTGTPGRMATCGRGSAALREIDFWVGE